MRAAFAALILAATAGGAAPHVLRAQGWTGDSAALAHDLTHAPRECVISLSPQAEAGRALFRSPGLLGGPAARIGLSCNACHSNGRVNATFLLPELTNRAGAADVTSEWASKVRGDDEEVDVKFETERVIKRLSANLANLVTLSEK